jgi:hypothetical protein
MSNNYINNNTTVVNIQNYNDKNSITKAFNIGNKSDLDKIEEVQQVNSNSKSCWQKCCKCCKYGAIITGSTIVTVCLAAYIANVTKNVSDLKNCQAFDNFRNDIQPILDGEEISKLLNNGTTAKNITDKIYNAYKKHLAGKFPDIKINQIDLQTTFEFAVDLNNYLADIRQLAYDCKEIGGKAKPYIDSIIEATNSLNNAKSYNPQTINYIQIIMQNAQQLSKFAAIIDDKNLKDRLSKAADGFYLGNGYDNVLNSAEGFGNLIYEGDKCIPLVNKDGSKNWCNIITKLFTGWLPYPKNNSKNKYSLVKAFGKDKLKIE